MIPASHPCSATPGAGKFWWEVLNPEWIPSYPLVSHLRQVEAVPTARPMGTTPGLAALAVRLQFCEDEQRCPGCRRGRGFCSLPSRQVLSRAHELANSLQGKWRWLS